jgi:Thiol:disulfide interchange protein
MSLSKTGPTIILLLCLWPVLLMADTPFNRLNSFFRDAPGTAVSDQEFLDPDQAFTIAAEFSGPYEVVMRWDIAKGYYLYRDKFRFTVQNSGAVIREVILPQADRVEDPEFGEVEIYRDAVKIRLPLEGQSTVATRLEIAVVYQGCKEGVICYPPISKTVSLLQPAAGVDALATGKSGILSDTRLPAQEEISRRLLHGKFWLNLLVFFGFGLLLAGTPCVFPMLPILSGIIVEQGHGITTYRALVLSLGYVLAMAMTYAALGVIAGAFQFNLQTAAQNTWVLSAFSAVFVLLALSMFGFYELQLPSGWQGRLASIGRGHHGSFLGAALMGAMSAIIVSPCIAPPLSGALIFINQTGDALTGGTALLSLGLGMGLPLLVFGVSAGRFLPRAGAWMVTVKRSFGIVMLGVAIWFLERIVPPSLTLFLWGLLLVVSAVYLGVFDRLMPDAPWQRLWKGISIVMLAYGIALIIGSAGGGTDVFRPLQGIRGEDQFSRKLDFQRIKTIGDLDSALILAAEQKRAVMLDFYADWCITCKELEKDTFSKPAVQDALNNVMLLMADVSANDASDQALLNSLGIIAPPAILFFTDGREHGSLRIVGYINAGDFITHLRRIPIL